MSKARFVIFVVFSSIAALGFSMSCSKDPAGPENTCPPPTPANSDTLHGQYTWANFGVVPADTMHQFSYYVFIASNSKFVFRPEPGITARFMEATKDFMRLDDSVYLDSGGLNTATGGSPLVPTGWFVSTCQGDSLILQRESSNSDTIMRISIYRP